MYMSTRANLDYWSTDNCCVRWSLRTGACAIGVFSLVWQSVMMSAGVLMLVQCPIPPEANLTNHVVLEASDTATAANLTNHIVLEASDTITTKDLTNHVVLEANDMTTTSNLTDDVVLEASDTPTTTDLTNHVVLEASDITTTGNLTDDVVLEDNDTITTANPTNHVDLEANTTTATTANPTNYVDLEANTTTATAVNLTNHVDLEANTTTATAVDPTNHVAAEPKHTHVPSPHTFPTNQEKSGIITFAEESGGCVSEAVGSSNSSSTSSNSSSSNSSSSSTFSCPWLPEPETEILGVKDKGTLMLVAGIFVTYSSIYCILSFSVVLGTIKGSVHLLQGWVAFTSFHNILILVFLLVPLPFTTLPHLLLSITHFVASLYMWAVVKSYMHTLKVEKKKVVIPDDAITDFSVDGVDVTEIPVEV
ncbi:uncharacterized protein [Panulirus ornatus]|uniref:uncharacterized protein n=1 Tax=Panulirus ornatus TaxID=150431 RepID=UPI003A8A0B60